jgi:hypothetical protein
VSFHLIFDREISDGKEKGKAKSSPANVADAATPQSST